MTRLSEKYEFIKKLDWRTYLSEDEIAIADEFGIDGLLWMIDRFKGMPVYFTEARIDEMKKDYVQKNPDNLSPRALARKVGYSIMTIYRYIGTTTQNNPGFFDDNN